MLYQWIGGMRCSKIGLELVSEVKIINRENHS